MNFIDLLNYYLSYGKSYNFICSPRNSGRTFTYNQIRVRRIKRKVRDRQLSKKRR